MLGWSEGKVVVRFWMVEFIFVLVGLLIFYADWAGKSGLLV
jgi:phospho-N-acetylmuramoyl-pentapeptide-transferase